LIAFRQKRRPATDAANTSSKKCPAKFSWGKTGKNNIWLLRGRQDLALMAGKKKHS